MIPTARTHHLPVAVVALGLLALIAVLLPPTASATSYAGDPPERVGESADPVVASIQLSQARGGQGAREIAVIGRSDVFADNLAATALAGTDGVLLLTDGGPTAALRPEVRDELRRTMATTPCTDGAGPTVYLVGGEEAVSAAVEDELRAQPWCVERLAGPTRIETAIAIADELAAPSDTVFLARADDWADAAAIGSRAARTSSRILVVPTAGGSAAVLERLSTYAPSEIVLLGGEAALSADVEAEVQDLAPTVRRVAGAARDATAVAIATDVWGGDAGGLVALADGYAEGDWTYMLAGAAYAAERSAPVLYTSTDVPTPDTQAFLDQRPSLARVALGPGTASPADLSVVDVALEVVGTFDAPMMLKPRPDVGELWVAERAGRIRAIGGQAVRTVLDISDTVSTNGERGLLGFAFHPDGQLLWTSTTDNAGSSVIDEFDIIGDSVDVASRREVIRVAQPASNHNGGDLNWGPDGYLWWSLGDGGGGGDQFGNGQRADTLLGTLVRIDPIGGEPYAIPPDNPFADGAGGAPEVWAYGLRNPFRFSFDVDLGDLYIGDVGQGAVEEIDHVRAGAGAGSNFGWPVFEGNRPFAGSSLDGHVPPVFEEFHADGNCSITGGVVYRGDDVTALNGAYVYTDLCRNGLRAIVVEDGVVTQSGSLGVSVGTPVGFGVDHDGEVYVMSLEGQVLRLTQG